MSLVSPDSETEGKAAFKERMQALPWEVRSPPLWQPAPSWASQLLSALEASRGGLAGLPERTS